MNGAGSLSDIAAESLRKHAGPHIYLEGLPDLSDAAAEHVGWHEGSLYLNGLTELSDPAEEHLGIHQSIHIHLGAIFQRQSLRRLSSFSDTGLSFTTALIFT